jgi:hypothetical protein
MRFFLILLCALALSGNATAAYRMQHDCCPDQACALQCCVMNCAPAALAIAPPLAHPGIAAVVQAIARHADRTVVPSAPVEEIWTPPD